MNYLDLDGLTDAQRRLFAVRCVRRVQHLLTDSRSLAALNVAERHAKSEATDKELAVACDAAAAAGAASNQLLDCTSAAKAAARWVAARPVTEAAKWAATWAAEAIGWAAAAAGTEEGAAVHAERAAQRDMLAQMKKETEDTP